MPTQWIRVRDTRTNEILPNPVPAAFAEKFDYLKEVPSSRRRADRVRLTEPVQPAAGVPIEEPLAEIGHGKPITEPAKPGKK